MAITALTTVSGEIQSQPLNDNFSHVAEEFNLHLSDTAYYTYIPYIITVGTGKDFTNITDAINSITDNSKSKRYEIEVYPGTYAERIILKPYVGVRGVDKNSVIFEWNRPLSTPDSEVTSDSMVELHDDGTYIKNITVKGQNFRYMVHTEFSTESDKTVEIEDCFIEHNGNDVSYTWTAVHAWGVGLGVDNTKIIAKNTTFIGASGGRGVLIHDNTSPTSSSYTEFNSCEILSKGGTVYEGLNLDNWSSYAGTIPWYATVNNCKIQVGISVTGTINRCKIYGGGNSTFSYYNFKGDWVDSSAGYIIQNASGSTIDRGTAVTITTDQRKISGAFDATDYTDYSKFVGFTLEDIVDGEYGKICFKGLIDVKFAGSATFLDLIMLDSNGEAIQYDETTSNRRPPIGKLISTSAVAGEIKKVLINQSLLNYYFPSNALIKGSNVRFYASGGVPVHAPQFIGQFYVDTVAGGVYFGIGLTLSDWERIN